MNIELRNRVWYATLLVPADVREKLGATRFKKSLATPNKRDAILKAAPFIAQWKAQIAEARGSSNAVADEVKRWRMSIEETAGTDEAEAVELALSVHAESLEDSRGKKAAKEFYEIATGVRTPAKDYYDAWSSQLDLSAKTKDQMVKDVALLVAKFDSLESVTKSSVKLWTDELVKEGKGHVSIERILSGCRNYWRYLKSYDKVPAEAEPFTGILRLSKVKKARAAKAANLPYRGEDVVKLWEAANTRRFAGQDGDTQLADLILLGAYTGARIEELCSLKVTDVDTKSLRIGDSKTPAGIREVPIHSKLAEVVKRLKKDSTDEYLLSGLTFNKYDDRSNAIGKRFGRLKDALGFGEGHTFHSLRSTVVTQLENAGVSENRAADIVGHEKPRITYGLYSGGANLAEKAKALAKVSYPF